MSDDTPTIQFGQSAEPPTQRTIPGSKPPEKKSRRPLAFIIILGALVLIAIIVIIILLLNRSPETTAALNTPSATPTTSATPTQSAVATPTPTQSHTTAPPATGLQFTNYSISPLKIDCSTTAPASAQYMTIKWTSLNGQQAYFGVNTTDAKANGMGWNLPPSGSNHDFPPGNDPYSYQCGNASMTYTITIVGANGTQQSKTITVSRK